MKLSAHKKQIAVLIDPDKMDAKKLLKIIAAANHISIDFFLIGGSLILKNNLETCIQLLKKNTSKKFLFWPNYLT